MGSLGKVELMALTNDAYPVSAIVFPLVSPQVFFHLPTRLPCVWHPCALWRWESWRLSDAVNEYAL